MGPVGERKPKRERFLWTLKGITDKAHQTRVNKWKAAEVVPLDPLCSQGKAAGWGRGVGRGASCCFGGEQFFKLSLGHLLKTLNKCFT